MNAVWLEIKKYLKDTKNISQGKIYNAADPTQVQRK